MIWIFVISYFIGLQMGPVALEIYEWWRDPERTYSGPQIQASEMWEAAAEIHEEMRSCIRQLNDELRKES